MMDHTPSAPADHGRRAVMPLPIALYVSGDLIFELYDGGQASRRFSICWERLAPTIDNEPEITLQSTQPASPTQRD
jgi:hypothetical protein